MRRKRIKGEKGIYRDAYGLSAIVTVGPLRREKRWPDSTPLKTIRRWRDETRVALRVAAPTATRGTFLKDVEQYLKAVSAMPTYKERAAHVALWCEHFGARRRSSITTDEISAILSGWLNEGYAPSTVRNRRTALMHVWTVLDGRQAFNPVRGALMPRLPDPEARALSYEAIRGILDAMEDSKTKARLAVIAFTGLPHALVKRLTPEMVDWDTGTVTVPSRHKGAGVKTRTLALTDLGLAALGHFAALDAWGPFSNSAMIKCFHRACVAAKVPLARVYDLRHSYATQLYRQTGDAKATAAMLMHSESSRMMDRYTIGGVEPRLKLAARAFNRTVKAPEFLVEKLGSQQQKRGRKRARRLEYNTLQFARP